MRSDAQVIDAIYMLRERQQLARVLGSRKTWIVLRSSGHEVARCTVERLMREMGWRGALKRKRVRTTSPDPAGEGSGQPPLRRGGTEPAVGSRLYLLPHDVGVGLHCVRHRRLCPQDRRLEGGVGDDHPRMPRVPWNFGSGPYENQAAFTRSVCTTALSRSSAARRAGRCRYPLTRRNFLPASTIPAAHQRNAI